MISIQWNNFALNNPNIEAVFAKQNNALKDLIEQDLGNITLNTPFYKVICPGTIDNSFKDYEIIAQNLRQKFNDIVIIGMGGAALNPKSLLGFLPSKGPEIHFLDSTDPLRFDTLIGSLDLSKSAFLVISNSGETVETILLFKTVLSLYSERRIANSKDHFLFITSKTKSTLRNLAIDLGSKICEHEISISGRYSSFTNVVILPGLIAGLDMAAFLKGAQKVMNDFWQKKEKSSPALNAAMIMALEKSILVNVGYLDCFKTYLEWYCQIIAESLGKEGKGFTPIGNIAPEGHHSVFQLYLGGPKDKTFSLFYVKNLPHQSTLKANNAAFNAANMALEESLLPTRSLILEDISEESIGALMAHSIIEVILLGLLLKVNPFDQPHVELIKKYLSKLSE